MNETNMTEVVTPEILALSNSISTMTKGCRFISLDYIKGPKSKGAGERARYVILVGFSYIEMVKDSIEELTPKMANMTGLELEAATAIMASLRETLEKHAIGEQNSAYTKKGMYAHVRGGVNINLNDNTIQLFGRIISKTILKEGEPIKPVNSKPLTIAKRKIEKDLSISKFREFALDTGRILAGKVNGETFECASPEEIGMEINPVVPAPTTVVA